MVTIRAKMRVSRVIQELDCDGKVYLETVELHAVSSNSEENKQWAKWTPSATVNIAISNLDAMGKLSKGHEFYVDFTPVE